MVEPTKKDISEGDKKPTMEVSKEDHTQETTQPEESVGSQQSRTEGIGEKDKKEKALKMTNRNGDFLLPNDDGYWIEERTSD